MLPYYTSYITFCIISFLYSLCNKDHREITRYDFSNKKWGTHGLPLFYNYLQEVAVHGDTGVDVASAAPELPTHQ